MLAFQFERGMYHRSHMCMRILVSDYRSCITINSWYSLFSDRFRVFNTVNFNFAINNEIQSTEYFVRGILLFLFYLSEYLVIVRYRRIDK